MAFSFTKLLSLLIVAVVLTVKQTANAAAQCVAESEGWKMAPYCAEAGQNEHAPVSAGCCNAVHRYTSDPACLCAVMLSKAAKAAGIDPAIAMTIPKRCQFSDRPVGFKCGAYTVP